MKKEFIMAFDEHYEKKIIGYFLYRSIESNDEGSIVNGLYIQRKEIGESPPKKMKMVLEEMEF